MYCQQQRVLLLDLNPFQKWSCGHTENLSPLLLPDFFHWRTSPSISGFVLTSTPSIGNGTRSAEIHYTPFSIPTSICGSVLTWSSLIECAYVQAFAWRHSSTGTRGRRRGSLGVRGSKARTSIALLWRTPSEADDPFPQFHVDVTFWRPWP